MTLPRQDGGDPVPPDRPNRRKDAQFVVNEDIPLRRIEPFDVVQLLLLVNVDQDIAVESFPNARALNLAGLKDRVAIRQDHRGSHWATRLTASSAPG